MASAFNTSVSYLEDELTQLILDGQISARIDSHAKVRYNTNSISSLYHHFLLFKWRLVSASYQVLVRYS